MTSQIYDIVSLAGVAAQDVPTLLSLQGLANRAGARLYLLPGRDGPEHHWVRWLTGYGLTGKEMSVDTALAEHAKRAKGLIVYDPKLPDSVNVAISLAGTRDAVVCPPSGVERLSKLGLAPIEDLTGRWSDKLSAYGWAAERVMKDCDGAVLANYEQGRKVTPRPTTDFLVARRGFCMGLTINEADFPDEAALWHQVQSAAPDHAMMLGWHTKDDSEATHVYFGSRHNVWVYCAGAWNMSFHQHVRARKPFSQRRRSSSSNSSACVGANSGCLRSTPRTQ